MTRDGLVHEKASPSHTGPALVTHKEWLIEVNSRSVLVTLFHASGVAVPGHRGAQAQAA